MSRLLRIAMIVVAALVAVMACNGCLTPPAVQTSEVEATANPIRRLERVELELGEPFL